jgi:regulator-associated protein of mTOR
MTAVTLQHNGAPHRQQYRQSPNSSNGPSPHQFRPQSYTSSGGQSLRQEPPLQNGTSGVMNPRPTVSNDPVQVANGHATVSSDPDDRSFTPAAMVGTSTSEIARDRRLSLPRPTSSPAPESSQDESERDKPKRRPKALLQRSKSDFGPRGEDPDSEEEIQDWGARHGFEDHYASEEYVSQLANVSRAFLRLPALFPLLSTSRLPLNMQTYKLYGAGFGRAIYFLGHISCWNYGRLLRC